MPRSARRLLPVIAIAAGLACATPAAATNYVVNLSTDPDNTTGSCAAAGNCSLRQAVNTANANAGPDSITFALNTVNVTNVPDPSGIVSFDSLTIDGGGTVTVNGTGGARLFRFNPGVANVSSTLKNITLQGIPAGSAGGAMLISGGLNPTPTNTVTLDRVTVRNNTLAAGDGGGAQVGGQGTTLNVVDSTFAGNSAPAGQRGGGIFVATSSNLNVTRSTFSANTAPIGGGINVAPGAGAVNVVNSTFSGNSNSVGGLGGAIYDDNNAVNLSYSTFTGNTSGAASGAVEINGGSGSDIKGNVFTANSPANCKTVTLPTSAGFNFDSGTSCVTGANPTDQENTAVALGALQNNGGPTDTRALPSGSPAIDAAGNGGCTAIGGAALTTDQRGQPRPSGPACDAGAFEVQPDPPPDGGDGGGGGGDGGGGDGGGGGGDGGGGEIVITRTLTLSYSEKADKFKGALRSNEPACLAGKVKVFEKKKGKDPKVGSDKTDADNGKWSFKDKGADGKFYASAPEKSVPAGTCPAAKSKSKKV